MNTNDVLLRWSQMSLDQIEEEIRSGKDAESIEQLLGKETIADMQEISFAPPATGPREAVVLLPGMMGSLLSSVRGITTLVWINPLVFLNGNARYLQIGPDGRQDACPEVVITPVGVEKFTYTKIGLALTREVDLFEFPYDWRRTTEFNARMLDASLERWAAGTDRKFILVGHSLGGLLARAYLALFPQQADKRIKQLVMLGAPNYGAVTAIQTLFSGNDTMQKVDGLNKRNNIAEVVRSMPGLYNLLPPPEEHFPSGSTYAANWDLYNAGKWCVPGIRQEHLDNTRALYARLAGTDPQIPQAQIAGCNLQTMVSLAGDFSGFGGLVQAAVERLPRLTPAFRAIGEESGDGTVPLWSSRIQKAEIFYVQEKHVQMPNNRQVIEAVKCLIRGERCPLPVKLPEPRSILGMPYSVPAEGAPVGAGGEIAAGTVFGVPGAAEGQSAPEPAGAFAERLRSGKASQDDLLNLRFAF